MNFLQKQKNKKSGFTLIEMLVAVLIFSFSLTALLTISSRGLRVAKNAQNDVVGDYLAMEAVEVVRNLRDTALLKNNSNTSWQEMFFGGEEFLEDEGCFTQSNQSTGGRSCNFFNNSGELQLAPCSDCTVFYKKNSGNDSDYYYQGSRDSNPYSGVATDFTRKIFIKEINKNEILVVVKVDWKNGNVVYTENLFLWQ